MELQQPPLLPRLGTRVWLLLLANCLSNLGSGLTLPFLIVYLHKVRGMGLGSAGLVLALIGVAGIAATPVAGMLADRIGARRTFVIGELLFAAGTASFIPVTDFSRALGPALVFGAAGGLTWSGLYAMLGEDVSPAQRNEAFGISYALANVGIGIGAVIAGFVVDVHSAHSFVVLFAADAASNIVFAGVLLAIGGDGESTSSERATEAHAPAPGRGYRAVLADRTLLGALFVNTLLVTVGTSQVTSAYPAWVTGPAHSTPRIVGFGFAANTLMLVAVQLFVLRQIRRRRRTDMAAGAGVIFAATWVVVLVGGHAGGGRIAGALLVGALAIFALGESLLSPSLPALVNELSPEALRGRYNAVFTLSWQVGPIIGPALAGFLLGRGLGNALFLLLAGSCLASSACAVRLRSAVPDRADFAPLETQVLAND